MKNASESHKAAESLLRGVKLRRTPMRLALLEKLAAARRPLTVPQLLEQLPPPADAVTVYRTLNTFTGLRLVHRIRSEDRSWRYAIGSAHVREAHRHPHFVCEECGEVECLASSRIPATLVQSLKVARQYQVKFSEVLLHGLCPRCSA